MNYNLLFAFLLVEAVEFTVFWLIASAISSYFAVSTLSVFLPLVGIDIIVTVLSYKENIQIFIDSLLNKD